METETWDNEGWKRLHDEREAQREAEAREYSEAKRAEYRPTDAEVLEARLEKQEVEQNRERTAAHCATGTGDASFVSEDFLWRSYSGAGVRTHRRGEQDMVCPLCCEAPMDCDCGGGSR